MTTSMQLVVHDSLAIDNEDICHQGFLDIVQTMYLCTKLRNPEEAWWMEI